MAQQAVRSGLLPEHGGPLVQHEHQQPRRHDPETGQDGGFCGNKIRLNFAQQMNFGALCVTGVTWKWRSGKEKAV